MKKLDLVQLLILVALAIVFILAASSSVDSHFDNQDTMLCNSAKVSGNEEYLVKCQCFYKGEDIRCIYKDKK